MKKETTKDMSGYYDDDGRNFFKSCLSTFLLICLIIAFFVLWTSCSPKVSKHQNDSVADRLRQRHAPVKLHNPNIK